MSNIGIIIEERAASIGSFMVGRLLPFRQKRMVGPFIFIDHLGPAAMSDHENFDVGPHPHIGLSTLTFLFEGSIMHRDSLGNEVEIKPGEVNWMTAGRGIVHSERTPEYLRCSDKHLHGLQIWVALPKELEQMEPEFFHISHGELPQWDEDGISFRLIAGATMGRKSPVPVYSPLYIIELKSLKENELKIGDKLFGETALYVLEGNVMCEGNTYGPRQLLVSGNAWMCDITLNAGSTIYIFGGDPFPEERYIYWNFVATSQQLIDDAKDKWTRQQMGKIAGDDSYVHLPGQNS